MKIFKILMLVLLVGCSALLSYMCYDSINTPIVFQEQKEQRDAQVIAKLIDIRKAQIEYKNVNGKYAGNIDSLIYFVKNGELPFVSKKGELTDEQLGKGLSEVKALAFIAMYNENPEFKGLADTVAKYEIGDMAEFSENFRRDTTYVSVLSQIFPKGYDIDNLKYVPFGNGAVFEVRDSIHKTKSGLPLPLFQAQTPFSVYLSDLNNQQRYNIIDQAKKLDKYPGLRVGDVEVPNNNAGNWE